MELRQRDVTPQVILRWQLLQHPTYLYLPTIPAHLLYSLLLLGIPFPRISSLLFYSKRVLRYVSEDVRGTCDFLFFFGDFYHAIEISSQMTADILEMNRIQ